MRIVETLRDMGYTFHIQDGAIRYKSSRSAPAPGAATLLAEIKQSKTEVLAYLNIPWPLESTESERKFGQGPARLYPFLNKLVSTPLGVGKLWQVGSAQTGVVLAKKPDKVTFVPWYEVRPEAYPVVRTGFQGF